MTQDTRQCTPWIGTVSHTLHTLEMLGFSDAKQPTMYVFGLVEKTGVQERNP